MKTQIRYSEPKPIAQKRIKWLEVTLAKAMGPYKDDPCYCLNCASSIIDEVIMESNNNGIAFLNTCTAQELVDDLL